MDALDTYRVAWNVQASEYQVYKVYIDGVEKSLTVSQKTNAGAYNFNRISANHVVDIYLAKPDPSGDIDVPTYPKEEYVKVDTQIIGGPGNITGGAVLQKNSNYDVT